MEILIGCEESQTVLKELRKKGHNAYSCDLKSCSGGLPQYHLKMDILQAIKAGRLKTEKGNYIYIKKWDAAIFFPDCTFLTCSAEWAYKEPPYHQKIKPGTLTGYERKKAREKAIIFVRKLYSCGIDKIIIENPVGILSSQFKKPDQIIQPYNFGDDASKKTCLWLKNLPPLKETVYVQHRIINGKKRWANQTDSGQNKLPPSPIRSKLRSKTFTGIAEAIANQLF